ncbi:TonB-dependent receptor [Tenacibaculum finnmarkense]|uniref:TonB-dependent receptor n=1 Tax=Tenacibaculum finnmarkense TaxID=2781243 RepID=UPI001E5D59BD|nr:TonB-dependent receptor [Tenacibaculum finnmarkense]MCD8412342.1 TonB-dependent receptor [Tenacibaculum finnmarkense genomovar ulcerans]MCG8207110.1 TonB-dependent receptor [Tenacibaculum finnmarkense genomovar finnmarkense]MCG8723397.1 TonB-dependent receptor [Tenacibaculum finnmarkense]MCG8741764.1 TonB-dependent receptor [Tenacibaculum finnmarkense]MCG8765061.1 TonB-dependent receptor [Tenacibaculum finnmarkense]
MKKLLLFTLLLLSAFSKAQTITGKVTTSKGAVLPFTNILIKNSSTGITSDENGVFILENIKQKKVTLIASSIGFMSSQKRITISKDKKNTVNFTLTEHAELLDQITVTGTRTDRRSTKNPVIVNVINSQTLADVQACNLSEGLKFQTGLRVETDCQTCNYTQLRMNGLSGGYSQILINGRPIFSPLTGLYGLEQIPTNMIDRIEVVRGGGSALYGSSAIGGTVNVITNIPKKNNYSIGYTYQNFKGASDHIIAGNATVVNEEKNAGVSFFINNRTREIYDHNGDNYSELPELKNNSFGTNLFFLPTDNQKIEVNFSKMNEYRYGGEMIENAPHFALQSEERVHDVYVGNVDYQINFNDDKSSLISYFASQYTGRDHYTGIRPETENTIEDTEHLAHPPYGNSETTTFQGGLQFNHKLEDFIKGNNVLTLGGEFVQDDVFDEIKAYTYVVDQITQNYGFFFQSDWEINDKWNLLAGVRYDHHKLDALKKDGTKKAIINNVASPRVSLLFKPFEKTQVRATWGTGFRAPQAFDTDLHMAFAGGGISRVQLADNLKKERSNSYTVSFNYDQPTEHYIYGFTVESFYTELNDAFYLEGIGEDKFGEVFEKKNGDGAVVSGITLETRLNYDGIFQFDAGLTYQSSKYNTAVNNSDDLESKKEFLRTPTTYGYATATYTPNQKFKTALNLVYTGKMDVLHLASDKNLSADEYFESPAFFNAGIKTSYTFELENMNTNIEVSAGVKNIFDNYQKSFDIGKERDSNFIYGPAAPRTYTLGFKIFQ